MKKLFQEAIIKFILGVLVIGLLLFIPAKSLKYWNAWLLMGLLFIPMFIVGIIMYLKAPDLLKSRLNAKEKQATQKDLIKYCQSLITFLLSGVIYFPL